MAFLRFVLEFLTLACGFWSLEQETTLVARCELHSVAEVKGQEVLLTVNSLNEFDSKITGVDWRQKIENQRGAVRTQGFSYAITMTCL